MSPVAAGAEQTVMEVADFLFPAHGEHLFDLHEDEPDRRHDGRDPEHGLQVSGKRLPAGDGNGLVICGHEHFRGYSADCGNQFLEHGQGNQVYPDGDMCFPERGFPVGRQEPGYDDSADPHDGGHRGDNVQAEQVEAVYGKHGQQEDSRGKTDGFGIAGEVRASLGALVCQAFCSTHM